MDQVPTTSGVDIRQPSTALFGVSSADRFRTPDLIASDFAPYPTWDPLVTYEIGDKVQQGEDFYVSITSANLGNDPDLTLATNWDYTDPPVSYVSRPGNTSPFAFTLQSNQNFLTGYFTRLALTEITFTWAIPTITARNNYLGIKYNTGTGIQTRTLTIPSGWYSLAALAAAVQAAVRAIAGNPLGAFTCTVNQDIGSFTAATNSAATFSFVPNNPYSAILGGAGSNPLTKAQPDRIQLYDMMNWASGVGTTSTTYTLATSQTSGVASLLSTKFVDIVCERLTVNQSTRDGDTGSRPRDVLARLYLTDTNNSAGAPMISGGTTAVNAAASLGSQPFNLYKEYGFPKQIAWDPNCPIGNLVFALYDDQGFPLTTMQTNATNAQFDDKNMPDWSFTLLASEV